MEAAEAAAAAAAAAVLSLGQPGHDPALLPGAPLAGLARAPWMLLLPMLPLLCPHQCLEIRPVAGSPVADQNI